MINQNNEAKISEKDQDLNKKLGFDFGIHRAGTMASFGEFLSKDRVPPVSVTFFKKQNPILKVTSRPFEDATSYNKALMEILFLFPSLPASTAFIGLTNSVKLIDRIAPCLVCVAVNRRGASAEVFPYTIVNGACQYDMDAVIDPNGGGAYDDVVGHMFPTFAYVTKKISEPSIIIGWLNALGHEVQFIDDWNIANIDARGDFL